MGRIPSCFDGAGIGSGRTCAGICDGEGAIRTDAAVGEDMCGSIGAGELCFVGEKEGRWAELGGKEECGLLKLYMTGAPFAAGECLTGDPARPAEEVGRSKLWLYDGGCCDVPNGLEGPNELPFCCGYGM